jgi:glycosyltransferase involved in cell wall biosynthesis
MNIAIDVRTINNKQSGVGFYVRYLVEALQRIDQKNSYFLITNDQTNLPSRKRTEKWRYLPTLVSHENHILGDFWEAFYLPFRLLWNQIDIFHGPAFLIPSITLHKSTVVTIHDLVAYSHPHTIPRRYKYYMRMLIKLAAMRANKIIVDSCSVKNELIDRLNIPEYKIQVVPLGVSPIYKVVEDPDLIRTVKERFGIKKDYLLQVGNIEPRKNLSRLFEAFSWLRKHTKNSYQLVNVGKKGWLYKDIFELIDKHKLHDDIIFTGYVSEEDLVLLYNGAELLVYPSLYEGFGLPILEAMSCGTPVITSKISSMPEVAGKAGLLIDPLDSDELAWAIYKLLTDTELKNRMRAAGLERAALFSWEKTAQQTLEVYEETYTHANRY